MSNEWRTKRLQDLATIVGRGITPKYSTDGDFLVSNQKCVRDGRLSLQQARRHDSSMRTVRAGKVVVAGDILVNSKGVGTLGRTAPVLTSSGTLTADSHVTIVRPNSHVDARWLAYAVSFAEPQIEAMAEGSTGQTELSRHRLAELELCVPPVLHQQNIARTLGALDDKIESNRRSLTLIADLLDAHSESRGAGLPTVPLGELVTPVNDSVNPAKLIDSLVDHFSLPAFDGGARPERVAASTIMSNKLRIPADAILLSRLNPRFNRTWWATVEKGVMALASTEYLVLTAKDDLQLAAAWLAVRDPFFRTELPNRVTGTSGSHQRVRPDDVLSIEVPDFSQAHDNVKESALALLRRATQLGSESDHLAALRDALLSELLSGRIRVPIKESTI